MFIESFIWPLTTKRLLRNGKNKTLFICVFVREGEYLSGLPPGLCPLVTKGGERYCPPVASEGGVWGRCGGVGRRLYVTAVPLPGHQGAELYGRRPPHAPLPVWFARPPPPRLPPKN